MRKDKNNYRILIVEDNEGDFILIEDLLCDRIAAPVVIRAKNAAQAEEMIRNAPMPFDVILLDQYLPDKSGQILITQILKSTGETPVVILTAFSDFNFSVSTISQGISDYLGKDDLTAANLYKSIIYAIERNKMMLVIADSEKRFSDLFNLSPQPMWVFDTTDLFFLSANKATTDLFEYTKQELLSMNILDIQEGSSVLKKGDGAENLKKIAAFKRQTLKYIQKAGNKITLDLYSNLITFKGQNACYVTGVDVTEKLQEENRITRAIINTQEKERSEMGRELHDNVCQILVAGRMKLEILKPLVAQDKILLFEESMANIKLAADEIRNLSHRLAPAFYDISDLKDALFRLVKTYNPSDEIRFSINIDNNIIKENITRSIQLNMYRILQEQLGNIIKHAKATAINIDILVIDSFLQMLITDNGIGFDTDQKKTGIGLSNIKKRAQLFGGSAEFFSSPGNGCIIDIHIPLNKDFKDVDENV